MSVYELDLNGQRVTTLRVSLPLTGAWTADLELAGDAPIPAGPQTLTVGNLALVGAVVRQDSIAGGRTVRLVGGAGGWATALPPQSYQDDAGVVRATVLRDLAALTGETMAPADLAAATDAVGTSYVREGAEASRTLEQLAPGWWVDAQGLTHVGARPPAAVLTPFLVEEYGGASGGLVASTEDVAAWTPGALVASPLLDQPLTLVDVAIVAGNDDQLRVEALVRPASSGGGGLDRVLGLLRAIIRHEVRALTFAGIWEYQVAASRGAADGRTLVDGFPLASVTALPPLRSVEVRPGVPGLSCAPAVGSRILVAFVNQDPARPAVIGFDSTPPTSATVASAAVSLGVGVGVPVALAPQIEAWAAAVVAGLAAASPPITVPALVAPGATQVSAS
jgi:hypothetical protein